ncbi:MAG: hypothetical protein GF364_10630 [Candidatus Lokiarchaeota archaeon]|nr:hypothetical protein [Candidatus Lokiarchaeota archaeon]
MSSSVGKFFRELRDRIKTSIRMRIESPFIILALIMIIALGVLVRCSPIFRSHALIKAFDPWIQYYSTEYLSEHSLYEYYHWYSYQFWFPEGTPRFELRPGLVFLTTGLYKVLNFFGISVTIFDLCYAWPVIMGGLTILIMFFLGKEILDSRAGLLAAFFLAFSPGHMQRTVLGFYDNETIGVFCILGEFLFFIKCIKSGKAVYGVIGGLFLGTLALSWGALTYGYLLLPLTSLILIISNKYSSRLLIAYITTVAPSLLLYMFFARFQSRWIINEMELFASGGFLIFLLVYHVFDAQKTQNPKLYDTIWQIIKWGSIPTVVVFGLIFLLAPEILPFGLSTRGLSILNPTIRNDINLVASVGEHKPSPWSVFYFNSLIPVILTPLGVYFGVKRAREEDILMLTFVFTLLYFTGSMIRIILLLAPALALVGAYGLSHILKFFGSLYQKDKAITRRRKRQVRKTLSGTEATVVFLLVGVMLFTQINHATTTTIEQMSWTEIVAGGSFHDWEEALSYLEDNLEQEDVVVSWWDYGYWLSVIGNVTTVNDNGTNNHTRLGLTGMAMMQTNEIYSAKAFQYLHADYVCVYFGHLVGGLGGDEGKWPWMLRICNDHTENYRKYGYEEDNWKENTVFDESEYINSSSGLYEDKWFETTLVKLMFYGEPTTVSAAQTQLQAYYATQIEGNEGQNVSPRQDDNGNTWLSHIPQNGQYDFTCFVPYYFSSNHLVKVFKVDYTALESSFQLENPNLYNNGFGNVKIENTGTKAIETSRIQVNNIWYNYTIDNSDKEIQPGQTKTIWFDTNQFGQKWNVSDPYNVTVEVTADALEGRTYQFTNSTEDNVVMKAPQYSIDIDRSGSELIVTNYEDPVSVKTNITNTGDALVRIDEMKLFGTEVPLNATNNDFLLSPGETQEFTAPSIGGLPGVAYSLFVNTSEGAYDSVDMAVNLEDYDLRIMPDDRGYLTEEMIKSEELRDLNRRIIFPDNETTILYDNGTLVMTVKNEGSKLIGLEGVTINDELLEWTDWETINGDKLLYPGESVKIKTEVALNEKNELIEIAVNATGQGGETSASDICTLIPVNEGKSISIVTDEVTPYTDVIANETVFVTVKNVGMESVLVDNINLNSTGAIDLEANDAIILYGDLELDTYEVVKFAVNTSTVKLNASDSVELEVSASSVTDTADLTATLPYDGETIVISTDTDETYGDASEDEIYVTITVAGFHNMTLDTIRVNGTYISPAQMTFESEENVFEALTDNMATINSAEFGFPDIIIGQRFEVIVTMVEGPVKTYELEVVS